MAAGARCFGREEEAQRRHLTAIAAIYG